MGVVEKSVIKVSVYHMECVNFLQGSDSIPCDI